MPQRKPTITSQRITTTLVAESAPTTSTQEPASLQESDLPASPAPPDADNSFAWSIPPPESIQQRVQDASAAESQQASTTEDTAGIFTPAALEHAEELLQRVLRVNDPYMAVKRTQLLAEITHDASVARVTRIMLNATPYAVTTFPQHSGLFHAIERAFQQNDGPALIAAIDAYLQAAVLRVPYAGTTGEVAYLVKRLDDLLTAFPDEGTFMLGQCLLRQVKSITTFIR